MVGRDHPWVMDTPAVLIPGLLARSAASRAAHRSGDLLLASGTLLEGVGGTGAASPSSRWGPSTLCLGLPHCLSPHGPVLSGSQISLSFLL